jgi:C4-dicarboxylate-specific signal transduction histidine kinase
MPLFEYLLRRQVDKPARSPGIERVTDIQERPLSWPRAIARYWKAVVALLSFNIAIISVGGMTFNNSQLREEEFRLARASGIADTLEEALSRFVETIDLIHRLAGLRNRSIETDNILFREAIEDELRAVSKSRGSAIFQIAVIDRNGYTAWSSVDPDSRVWLGDRMHFLVHKQGRTAPYVSGPVFGRVSGRWSLQFTRSIMDANGMFAGVVVVSVDPLALSAVLDEPMTNSGDLVILSRAEDGLILTISENAENTLSKPHYLAPEFQKKLSIEPNGAGIGTGPFTGATRFLAYRSLKEWPITVVVSLDWGEWGTEVRMLHLAGALLIAMIFVASVLTLLWLLQVSRSRQKTLALALSEERLHQSKLAKLEFDRLLNNVNTVIYTLTLPFQRSRPVKFETENTRRVLGFERDESDRFDNIVVEADREIVSQMRANVLIAGRAVAEYRVTRPDGRVIRVRDQCYRITDPDSLMTRAIGTIDDVTEWHDLMMRSAAENKLALLGQVVSSLGHELAQPIAIIGLSVANIIQFMKSDDPVHENIRSRVLRIERQVARANEIMTHLRMFSHPNDTQEEILVVGDLISACLSLYSGALEEANIEVLINIEKDLPNIVAQRTLGEQIILNIISNIIDAFSGLTLSARKLWIEVSASSRKNAILVVIRDNAGGISPSVLSKIFEFFVTTKPRGKGTGLGLPLAKNYALSMGGDLTAENVSDGAKFIIEFRTADGS